MTTGTRAQFQRAIDKAQKLGTIKTVQDLGSGRFAVSGHGATYVVSVADGEYACTCTAGELGRPCYHQAAVWKRHVAERACHPAAVVAESDAQTRERVKSETRLGWQEADDDQADYAEIYGKRVA